MVFSSMTYLFVFLPMVLLAYFIAPPRARNMVLLAFSLIFYAWGEPVYIFLMLMSITVNYVFGRIIANNRAHHSRYAKLNLGIAVGWNLTALGIFKYYPFVSSQLRGIGLGFIPGLKLLLHIGISFYTFQAISYLVDIYRNQIRVQRGFFKFALYISMFPQLIAGPIVRYEDVEKQLSKRKVTLAMFGNGGEFFLRGLIKKVLLANQLGALYVQIESLGVAHTSVLTAWLGAFAYTFQIYFDFSGYSDMAIGLGKMFGFRFPKNFDYPYTATSITSFWRRWHISLSSWFREYVYIPLGGKRVSPAKHVRNILIVWMLTGFWHGAGWNFMLWGLYYGILLLLEKYVIHDRISSHPWPGRILTFLLVTLGWMFFVHTDFSEMLTYVGHMFGVGCAFANATTGYFLRTGLVVLLLGAFFSTPIFHRLNEQFAVKYYTVSIALRIAMFMLCVAALVYQSYNPFLYFRF